MSTIANRFVPTFFDFFCRVFHRPKKKNRHEGRPVLAIRFGLDSLLMYCYFYYTPPPQNVKTQKRQPLLAVLWPTHS